MYLHEQMEDMDGISRQTCGVISGKCYRTPRLTRFGYITLTAGHPVFGQAAEEIGEIPAHEFHYFDSTSCGTDFHAKKPLRKRSWDCIHGTETQLFGFPHLYYYSNPALALEFLEACVRQRSKNV